MNPSEQPIITILAEGGSITLFKTNETFLFNTSEIIDLEDDFIIKKVPQTFLSFSEAFTALFNKYPIFKLHLDEVHPSCNKELKKLLKQILRSNKNTYDFFNASWLIVLKKGGQ